MIDDIVIGFEDAVGEPVVAHELPDILHRVQFGTSARQRHEGDIAQLSWMKMQIPNKS